MNSNGSDDRDRGGDHDGDREQVCPPLLKTRASERREAAVAAEKLRDVAELAGWCADRARAQLLSGPRVTSQPDDIEVVHSAVIAEVAAGMGWSEHFAAAEVDLAMRLTQVLPETLDALAAGRLDLFRARTLVLLTRVLDLAAARAVQAEALGMVGDGPWQLPSPRTWRLRVERIVARVDADAARRRQQQAVAERSVRSWAEPDGMAVLQLRATAAEISLADRAIRGLGMARPAVDTDGQRLSIDQRNADGLIDVFRHIADGPPAASDGTGTDLPRLPVRVEREIGLVLHTDTLLGDGPAAHDPGEQRGLGPPAPADARTAADLARAELARGAMTTVLLTDHAGVLQRLVPVGAAPEGGWTRKRLATRVREVLPALPPLATDAYAPTAAILEHVRVKHPRCVAYDCARVSRRCDLDHDVPWPRGPTDQENLAPRCRRHHEHKTRRLVHTSLGPDSTGTTQMLTGITITTRPEPLPGYGQGEGYGTRLVEGSETYGGSADGRPDAA